MRWCEFTLWDTQYGIVSLPQVYKSKTSLWSTRHQGVCQAGLAHGPEADVEADSWYVGRICHEEYFLYAILMILHPYSRKGSSCRLSQCTGIQSGSGD